MRKLIGTLFTVFCIAAASAGTLPLLHGGSGAPGGGGVTFMSSPIMTSGSTTGPTAVAINFGRVAGGVTNSNWGTTSAQGDVIPVAGTISNLDVYFPTDPTPGSYDVVLAVGGTKQTLTCNVATGSHTCSDNTHSVTVAAGNLISWLTCPSGVATCTNSGGSAPTVQATPLQISATFTSTVGQEGFLIVHPGGNMSATAVQYVSFSGNITWSTTEASVSNVIPAAGTIDDLYITLVGGAPGASSSITFTVFKNTSATSLTCAVSGAAATTCNDLTGAHGFTVAQGDTISVQQCPSNTATCPAGSAPGARAATISARWVPSTTNQALLLDTPSGFPSNSATRFLSAAGTSASGATETNELNGAPVVAGGMTMGNLTVLQAPAPGGATTRTITLRAGAAGGAGQANQSPACTVTSAATTCTSGNTYGATSGQALNYSTTLSGTNASLTQFKVGMTVTIP